MGIVLLLLGWHTSRLAASFVVGLLAVLSAVVLAAYRRFVRRGTARLAASKAPSTLRKGAPEFGPRHRSLGLAALIIACSLIAYLILVVGMVELILWCRRYPWPDPVYWATVLNTLFLVAIVGLRHQGMRLVLALERGSGRHRDHRAKAATHTAEPLWDRDLDCNFEAEARPVS